MWQGNFRGDIRKEKNGGKEHTTQGKNFIPSEKAVVADTKKGGHLRRVNSSKREEKRISQKWTVLEKIRCPRRGLKKATDEKKIHFQSGERMPRRNAGQRRCINSKDLFRANICALRITGIERGEARKKTRHPVI